MAITHHVRTVVLMKGDLQKLSKEALFSTSCPPQNVKLNVNLFNQYVFLNGQTHYHCVWNLSTI